MLGNKSIKPHKSIDSIAKKHNVSIDFINNQLKTGINVEKEHTKDINLARTIALQHLDEIPNYYTKLKKIESKKSDSEDAVKELEIKLTKLNDISYNSIDRLMRQIMKRRSMTAKELHNAFVKKHKKTPDDWIKELNEGTLHAWFKDSKSKDGKAGWVQADGSPCANEKGETKTPKCFSSSRLNSLKGKGKKGLNIIRSAVRRKREQDPNQQKKTGGASPTMVPTFAKGKKDKNYIKPEPTIKESMYLKETKKDKPSKGSGEKDACYYKVKARYKVWPSAYACVPESGTQALTKDSWKNVNELKVGDEIMTYNIENDELEFKPILNIHRYKNAKTNVIQSGNTGFIFECTDNHKWVVKLPKSKSSRINKYNRIDDKTLIETNDLLTNKNNKHLVVSAYYNGGNNLKKDKIFKYGDNWIKYILDISNEQRQSWLFSAIVYDGNQKKIERLTENSKNIIENEWLYTSPNGKQSFGFKQKDINHRDAFLLSAFLNAGIVTWKKSKNNDIYSCHYTSNKRFKNIHNFNTIRENITDVWCPETENKTWVMRQEIDGNGIITITGNSGALVKCRKSGSKNWGTQKEETYTSSLDYVYDGPPFSKNKRYCPKCKKDETREECKYGVKYWDMFSIPSQLGQSQNQLKYNVATVHPGNFTEEKDHEYSMARAEISKVISAANRLRKKVKKGEGNIEAWVQSKITKAADYIDTAADYMDSGEGKLKESISTKILKKMSIEGPRGSIGDDPKNSPGNTNSSTPLKEQILAEKCWKGYKKRGMKKKGNRLVPNCVKEGKTFKEFMSEATPAWQRKEGKNPEGGLNKKGIASYRKEHPGSKLSLAVTTKPSKLKKGSKSAKRRQSFCSRMKGMKAKLTSAKTANDPNSRINKSLRKWNC